MGVSTGGGVEGAGTALVAVAPDCGVFEVVSESGACETVDPHALRANIAVALKEIAQLRYVVMFLQIRPGPLANSPDATSGRDTP